MMYIQIFQRIPSQRKEFTKERDNRKKCDWMISNMRFLFHDFARFNNIILIKYSSSNLLIEQSKLFLYIK